MFVQTYFGIDFEDKAQKNVYCFKLFCTRRYLLRKRLKHDSDRKNFAISGCRRNEAWVGAEPPAEHVPADGQQVGDEAFRLEESSHTGTSQTKSGWSLDHSSLLQF
jgi:hypothetical protein